MITFGKIPVGTRFIFKGTGYTKMDDAKGFSIQANKEKVHFFTENEIIELT